MGELTGIPTYALVVASSVGVVLLLAILGRLKFALIALAGMLLLSSIGVARTASGQDIKTWLYPLQTNRSALFLALGVVLMLAAIGHSRSVTGRGLRGQGLVLLIMGLYAGLLRMIHESPLSGLQTVAFVMLTIIPILLVVQALLDEERDYFALARSFALVNLAWIAGVAVQVLVNPSILVGVKGARFMGLAGNPQNAGLTLAALAVFILWLLLNDPKRHLRALWLGLFATDLVLLAVTGSRTSAGTFVVGAMIATYGRLGRFILSLPILVAVFYLALYVGSEIFTEFGEAARRLASTQDTRTAAWTKMLQDGMEHPWIGVGVYETESENSYLKAFASYGMGMVALIMVMLGVSAHLLWRLYRLRRWLDPDRRARVDLVLAFNGMYFAASMLEGIMIARVTFYLTMMLVFSVIGTDLLRHETERIEQEFDGDESQGDSGYWDYDEYGREYSETGGVT